MPMCVRRCHQQLRPHHHVLVLHAGGDWAPAAQVPLVEEVHHHPADGNCPIIIVYSDILDVRL